MYLQTDDQLDDMSVGTLPRTLIEAVEAFEADPLSEAVMGPELKQLLRRSSSARSGGITTTLFPLGSSTAI